MDVIIFMGSVFVLITFCTFGGVALGILYAERRSKMEQAMIPEENNALIGLVIFRNEYCECEKCDDCAFVDGNRCRLKVMIVRLKKEVFGNG